MRKLAFAIALLAPLGAQAQNAITQVGPVLQNSPAMFAGDRQMRQGAGAAGAIAGRMITGGFGVVGGVCDFTGTTDTSPIKMCLDAASGSIIYNGVSYSPSLTGIAGPSTTALNEIASWNNLVGSALREGAAGITDSKTGMFVGDSAGITVLSKPGITAMEVANITCNNCGYTNYDAVRGVAVANAGSAVINTSAISGYVRNQNATAPDGLSKNAVGIMGFATGEVNGSATWGLNTITMDNSSYTTHAGARSIVGYEADIIVTSPLATAFGMLIIGNSLAQPLFSNGYSCLPLGDPFGTSPSPFHWSSCFIAGDGAANHGFALGALARNGTNVQSQYLSFAYFDQTSTRQLALMAVTGGLPRTLLVTSGAGSGDVGFGVDGNFYQTFASAAHFMGAASKIAAVTDASNNFFIAPDTWTTISLGTAAVPLTISSPTGMTQNLKFVSSTVGTLPACNAGALGAFRTVTDANAPTYGATVAGGGAVVIPVICDGVSAWKAH